MGVGTTEDNLMSIPVTVNLSMTFTKGQSVINYNSGFFKDARGVILLVFCLRLIESISKRLFRCSEFEQS
jgi:hypothetical protein